MGGRPPITVSRGPEPRFENLDPTSTDHFTLRNTPHTIYYVKHSFYQFRPSN